MTLTAGTVFLMWLGERIQERGVGNGISLIITAGILSRAPTAYHYLTLLLDPKSGAGQLQPIAIVLMVFFLIAVIISCDLDFPGAAAHSGAVRAPGRDDVNGRRAKGRLFP